ncbi:uncharacterized protein LOC123680342 [Harmonia axyridis]|uniref:uncharacterized protein LOC123680342 n=1 Tax=Harmonia axyridis TaxID=115357 RepID=UPI001E277ECD|nr:uncharacterized protein LOC123680342 [Harmonia axyridis]
MDKIQDILFQDDNIENNPLRCVVCRNFLSIPPILHDDTFGTICGRENCNKFATSNISYYRQSAYEALARFLDFPCKNKENGCQERLPWGEILEHEKICEFVGSLHCPFSTNQFEHLDDELCYWTGNIDNLLDHLEEMHSTHKFDDILEFDFKNDLKNNQLFYSRIQESIVIILVLVDKKSYSYCRVWSGPEIWKNLKYNMEISTEKNELLTSSKIQKAGLINSSLFKSVINCSWLKIDFDYIRNFYECPQSWTIKLYFNDFAMGPAKEVHCNPSLLLLNNVKCDSCNQELCYPMFVCKTNSHYLCEKCVLKSKPKEPDQQFTYGFHNQKPSIFANQNQHQQISYGTTKNIEDNLCCLCTTPNNKEIYRNLALDKLKSAVDQSFKHCKLCMKKVDCLSSHIHINHNESIHQLNECHRNFSSEHYVFSFDHNIFLLTKKYTSEGLSFSVQCLETRKILYKYELKLMNSKTSYSAITFSDFCHPEYTDLNSSHLTLVPYTFLRKILPYVNNIDFKMSISKI